MLLNVIKPKNNKIKYFESLLIDRHKNPIYHAKTRFKERILL